MQGKTAINHSYNSAHKSTVYHSSACLIYNLIIVSSFLYLWICYIWNLIITMIVTIAKFINKFIWFCKICFLFSKTPLSVFVENCIKLLINDSDRKDSIKSAKCKDYARQFSRSNMIWSYSRRALFALKHPEN